MSNFLTRFNEYVSMINDGLPSFLPPSPTEDTSVRDAMAYSLTGEGKRVRGVLLLAAYGLFSGFDDAVKAIPFAAAVEMVHAYSLIHDDLPCMDDDDLRRGRPSCHVAFGEAVALLAGDGLLTLAFEACTDNNNSRRFDAAAILKAANALALAAGTLGMIGGQAVDLHSEGGELSLEALRRMDGMKTGALISAAVDMGCILGGATETQREALCRYALDLGLAFQIRDDILDQTGDEKTLGKPIGSDDKNKKSTYTGLCGLEGARAAARELSENAKAALAQTGLETAFLRDLADYLLNREY